MRVYSVKGDFDLMWANPSDPEITGLLDHVVRKGAAIDRSEPISLEVSDRDAPGDWIATDCPHLAAYGPLLLSERVVAALGPVLADAGYLLDTRLASGTRYKLFICERECPFGKSYATVNEASSRVMEANSMAAAET